MDSFSSEIVKLFLVYSSISNHNTFSSSGINYLAYSSSKNINVILISEYIKVSNRQNRFVDFFVRNNASCVLTNSIIFDIYNRLNNFIPKFFG